MDVHRLGFAASYRPGKEAVYKAFDSGINFFFGFGIDTHLTKALREIAKNNREKIIIATGAYNTVARFQNVRKALEKRLRQFRTDYIDIFMDLGIMKPKHFPDRIKEELYKLKDEGKIKFTGISCHDRKFVGQLASNNALDTVMIRYNAAHRGAEEDIFPFVKANNTGVISYTATRWTYLIRKQKGWSEDKIPTAGQCYRLTCARLRVVQALMSRSTGRYSRRSWRWRLSWARQTRKIWSGSGGWCGGRDLTGRMVEVASADAERVYNH